MKDTCRSTKISCLYFSCLITTNICICLLMLMSGSIQFATTQLPLWTHGVRDDNMRFRFTISKYHRCFLDRKHIIVWFNIVTGLYGNFRQHVYKLNCITIYSISDVIIHLNIFYISNFDIFLHVPRVNKPVLHII